MKKQGKCDKLKGTGVFFFDTRVSIFPLCKAYKNPAFLGAGQRVNLDQLLGIDILVWTTNHGQGVTS